MKKLIIALIVCGLFVFTGCATAYEGSDTARQDRKIKEDFCRIEGHENLYYCVETNVVYWIGGSYSVNVWGDDYTTSYMTVYYASNGLPYLWDQETKELKEIE